MGNLLAKSIAATARRQLDRRIAIWRILKSANFVELNNFLPPKLADKHALSKMNLTLMEESIF